MSDDELTPERAAEITAAVDIEAAPPDGEPVALVLFGTNQAAPALIAAERYNSGAARLMIATGGINRHNGIIEGREFARQLTGQASRPTRSASRTSPRTPGRTSSCHCPTSARRWAWGYGSP